MPKKILEVVLKKFLSSYVLGTQGYCHFVNALIAYY